MACTVRGVLKEGYLVSPINTYIILQQGRLHRTALDVVRDFQLRNHHIGLGIQFDEGEVIGLVVALLRTPYKVYIDHVQTLAQIVQHVLTILIRARILHAGINTDADILDRTIYPSPPLLAPTGFVVHKAMKVEAGDDKGSAQVDRVTVDMHADISRLNVPLNG